jgi:ribosome-binding ATPase YchF (GTP1/OBG family)
MKVSLVGITGVPLGRHNVKDPRLDEADRLIESKKKVYAQVDVVGDDQATTADAVVVSPNSRLELILQDLEFVETRLGRNPPEDERLVLEKIRACLESDQMISAAGLTPEETRAVEAHAFVTTKPVVVAEAQDVDQFDEFLVRVMAESGYICFLTVGGVENRAWLIKKGTTALDAAGAIHTDIQKGFIRAEIISYADMIAAGGETEAKRANKQRLETKTYVMQDCDLTNFRFNK